MCSEGVRKPRGAKCPPCLSPKRNHNLGSSKHFLNVCICGVDLCCHAWMCMASRLTLCFALQATTTPRLRRNPLLCQTAVPCPHGSLAYLSCQTDVAGYAAHTYISCALFTGDHGSTFAGNPLVCQTGCTVFDIVSDPAFLASVNEKGERLKDGEKGASVLSSPRGEGCGIPKGSVSPEETARGTFWVHEQGVPKRTKSQPGIPGQVL